MRNADPMYIRTLLSRYADVQLRFSERPTQELQWQLDDVTYTLCATTGTRTVRDALMAADHVLERAAALRSGDESPAA
ncbi:DUF5133 domain-containing protein [Streptomyces kunmingensis]|uniref:DUF5133 domain-containing protein n=1 Tax=Streptomyces kunmingensis TaxID=68225 RepID=A0ABU6CA61_9ACTN|nr:DUF5133 domain-containing protein [Streptomyces kunmingensis]MEB3961597.1 DUF5133 domain-containing protein [Streptomyces kunmingensis]